MFKVMVATKERIVIQKRFEREIVVVMLDVSERSVILQVGKCSEFGNIEVIAQLNQSNFYRIGL